MSTGPDTTPNWLPAGEEPRAVGKITHCIILRQDAISVVSVPSGDIDAESEPSTGLYSRDTRYLSKLKITLGGVTPILLDSSSGVGQSAVFTNPAFSSPDGSEFIPGQALVLRRERAVASTMAESISISNYSSRRALLEVRLQFAADFRDIFEVRGVERSKPQPPVTASVSESEVCWSYTGSDDVCRTTTLTFSEPPAVLNEHEAAFQLTVDPRGTHQFSLEVSVNGPAAGQTASAALAHVTADETAWLHHSARITTDNNAINDMLRRSLLDIQSLETERDGHTYLAAGVPWFDTLFGRDSLIAGMEILAFAPEVLRRALVVLASYQAESYDAVHDAEPGKIAHEVRWGELAAIGDVPFGCYYGSVDVTPLFIVAAGEYGRWTDDYATIRRLWPNLQRAMEWCQTKRKSGPRGFLSYRRESSAGLENQGWKDSHDAIVWPDGKLVTPPIALVEVQGYLAAAFDAYGRIAERLGEPGSEEMLRECVSFRAAIDEAFASDELGYVLCLDGDGEPVPTPASNAGHLLWSGVARDDHAAIAASRLMQPDMFSGWGVRTLSTGVPGYNPIGYHTGSVWPHDNALLLAGLRRYGREHDAERLGSALIGMSLRMADYRVPELFSGDARALRPLPTPYPVASRPQAWAAASLPNAFVSMLGLRPGRHRQLCIVHPVLPREIQTLHLNNLRFGGGSADLSFRRVGKHVSVEVEIVEGPIEIVLSDAFHRPQEFLNGNAGD